MSTCNAFYIKGTPVQNALMSPPNWGFRPDSYGPPMNGIPPTQSCSSNKIGMSLSNLGTSFQSTRYKSLKQLKKSC